jgi:hypothetical protein
MSLSTRAWIAIAVIVSDFSAGETVVRPPGVSRGTRWPTAQAGAFVSL